MAHVHYPRTQPDRGGAWVGPTLGTLELVAMLPGVLGALEVLLVGEEMSTLSVRMLPLTHTGGPFGPETGLDAWAPLLAGGPVFVLSVLRFAGAIGMLMDRRWAFRLLVGLPLPSLAIDLACFATPWGLPWIAFDLVAPLALWRRAQ